MAHVRSPLRRIVRREKQNGRPYVVLICGHATPGVPAGRTSRFFPCPACGELVAAANAALKAQAPALSAR